MGISFSGEPIFGPPKYLTFRPISDFPDFSRTRTFRNALISYVPPLYLTSPVFFAGKAISALPIIWRPDLISDGSYFGPYTRRAGHILGGCVFVAVV